MDSFSFKVTQVHHLKEELTSLLHSNNIGQTTIRCILCHRSQQSTYYVDVKEPTKNGIELYDWLRRGKEYDRLRREQTDENPFPDYLHGPVWATKTTDGRVIRQWWLELTPNVGAQSARPKPTRSGKFIPRI